MIRSVVLLAKMACASVFLCLFPPVVSAQWSVPVENELLIVGGWLFVGSSDQREPNPGILIRNGKIATVGPDAFSAGTAATTVIEIDPGSTILPGMIDLHAH